MRALFSCVTLYGVFLVGTHCRWHAASFEQYAVIVGVVCENLTLFMIDTQSFALIYTAYASVGANLIVRVAARVLLQAAVTGRLCACRRNHAGTVGWNWYCTEIKKIL